MEKRVILLIGYDGLIGKYLHKFLSKKKNVSLLLIDKRKNIDITSRRSLETFLKKNKQINYIVNASGKNDHVVKTNNKRSFENDDILNEYIIQNVIGPKNLIELSSKICKNLKSIIHFSSLYGKKSPYHLIYSKKKSLSYCISKHAMEGLTKYYATLLAPKKIRINNIRVGGVKSKQPKKFLLNFLKKTPSNEMVKLKDIANTVDFLCSNKSENIIGENLSLEGGYNLW
jgi:NAD(P)-dependent dehydrogenase (short-subunit alcohol dehydrogenase family)